MSVKIAILTEFNPKGVKDAQAGLQKLGDINDKVFKAVGGAATLAAAGIAKFAYDSIGAASNLAESTNAVNVAFGESAQAVLKLGENSAQSLGLATVEFNQAAVKFSAFAERIAGSGGDTAKVIEDLSTRAADFASVFNIEVAEAMATFQSGLAGEAEPLKRFGVNLLEAEVKAYALRAGIIGVGESMDETQKVQARFGLLMESTAKTAGDFANTSDGLANQQRILKAEFTNLQAEIGEALLPAFTDLVKAVADQVLPKLKEVGEFLNSPEGKKMIEDTAKTVLDLTTKFIELLPTLVQVGTGLLVLTSSIKIAEAAFGAARLAAMLFSTSLAVTAPILGIIGLIGTLTVGLTLYATEAKKAREQETGLTGRTAELHAELNRLKELLDSNVIKYSEYQAAIAPVVRELSVLEGQVGATTGEFNRFNNMTFGKLKNELKGVSAEIMAMYHSGVAASAVFEGIIDPRTGKGVDFVIPKSTATGAGSTGLGSGPSEFEQARKKVQDLIKSSQKQLKSVQQTYSDSVRTAKENYANNILQIEKDFANRLTGIIQQSQDRLRSAYRSAVETNIGSLFDSFKSQQERQNEVFTQAQENLAGAQEKLAEANAELQSTLADPKATTKQISSATKAFEQAQKDFNELNEIVAKGLDQTNPADALVKSLTDKLAASRQLLANSAELASQGFSQTFIEQVVSAGTETGNELASAILNSTPETQAELQSLFGALEATANSGMDSLAKQIYEKQGLATQELKQLYYETGVALDNALIEQRTILDNSLTAANQAFVASVEEIKATLNEQLAEMEGSFGGMEKTIAQFIGKLDELIAKYKELEEAQKITVKTPSAPSTPSISFQPEPILLTTPKITTQPVPKTSPTPTTAKTTAPVININVKTDTTQSAAMVGKSIAKEVNKYTGGGGGLRGVKVVAI